MPAVDYADLTHTGPDTLAGRYLRTFWQPISRSQDLAPGDTIPVQIMSEWLTLYRGESGVPHVVAFRCAHRGTQLSTGWVEGDCIRCLYHGWKYDASGGCVEQPGEDEVVASRVRIRSYPTQEYLGLIFVYLGEGEPPPIKRFPDFEAASELAVGPPQTWPCNFFNRIDNACDPLHVGYTHRTALGRVGRDAHVNGRGAAATLTAQETDYGVRTTCETPGRPPDYLHFHMPNINQLGTEAEPTTTNAAASPWGDRLFWRVPIDDTSCVSYLVGILRLRGDPDDQERRRRAAQSVSVSPNDVAEAILVGKMRLRDVPESFNQREMFWVEDYVTEVGQGSMAPRAEDHLGRRDAGVLLLRKIWMRELEKVAAGLQVKRWTSPAGLLSVGELPRPVVNNQSSPADRK